VPSIFAILAFVAFAAIGIYAFMQEKKRKEAIRLWALHHGFSSGSSDHISMHQLYSGIGLFSKGHSRSAGRLYSGHYGGYPVLMTDYKYVTGSGKNRSTHRHGVVILSCDFPTMPLFIRRENVLDKVGGAFGRGDINFESSEFSDKFYVKSSDKKWAYDVIHSGTIDYLLRAPSFSVEFGFKEIVIYKNGYFDGPKYDQALDMAVKLRRLIPEYLVEKMKGPQS
jgi:hypothetical protein